MEKHPAKQPQAPAAEPDKDQLSQQDIIDGVNTFNASKEPHKALETADGKNNGAKPAAYHNQQSNHP